MSCDPIPRTVARWQSEQPVKDLRAMIGRGRVVYVDACSEANGHTATHPPSGRLFRRRIHSFLGAALQAGGDLLRREYALVYRAGLLNKAGALEVAPWDKLYDFAPLLIFKRSVSSPIGGGKSSHMHPSALTVQICDRDR
jgi:hypothetical protein